MACPLPNLQLVAPLQRCPPPGVQATHPNVVPLQGELAHLVPALTSLDLTGSLLSSWQAVQQLAGELPGLQTLDLSGSRLAMPQAPQELLPLQMAALRTLVLSSCCVTWAQVTLVLLILDGSGSGRGSSRIMWAPVPQLLALQLAALQTQVL